MPRNLKDAFNNSLKAEEQTVLSRFERAETALARDDSLTTTSNANTPPSLAQEEDARVKRDSFTMPIGEYELIASLQKKCLRAQVSAKKNEILRAGLQALDALSEEDLAKMIEALPKVKTGRPPTSVV